MTGFAKSEKNRLIDSLNRLTNVTDWASRQTKFEYDLASQLTKITRPNGSLREIRYDAAGQTTNIIERLTNNAPIAFFKLNWNSNSTLQWEFTGPLPHSYTPPTRTMTFDDDNRLLTLNSQNVTNDLDGNLTWGPLTNTSFSACTYDTRNRLLSAGGLSYGYDPAGNRVALTNGANVTRFVVNPNVTLSQVLMRVRAGVTNYYIYGAGLLYEVTETATSTNTATYHFDIRGSTIALTDGSGIPTDQIEYSAYGSISYRAGTNDTLFLYNGRYGVMTDPNGLLYMRARYYNPYICRFINPDPAGFSGGLNWYAYANGDPVSYLDPFGLGAFNPGLVFYLQGPGSQQRLEDLTRNIERVNYALAGVAVGVGTAGIVALAAPAAVSGLMALGVSEATATATVTTTLGVTAVAGGVTTGVDIYRNANAGNWNNVAFDAGNLAGGFLLGGGGGGRYIADFASPRASTVPVSMIPFIAERGYGFERNEDLPWLIDRWNWLGKGPTPSSGGASAALISSGLSSGFDLFTGQNPVDWLGNSISSSSTGKPH